MSKKQHISVRLAESDHRKMKDIARRLGVKESDLFRFIVKNSLNKLLPFQDGEIRGTDLIPALMECGHDLAHYFDLDAEQLDQIVNQGVELEHQKIEKLDLDLLALAGASQHYALIKLAAVIKEPIKEGGLLAALKDYWTRKYSDTLDILNDINPDIPTKPRRIVKTGSTIKGNHMEKKQYA